MGRHRRWIGLAVALVASVAAPGAVRSAATPSPASTSVAPHDASVHLNQVQAIGTHNSYHRFATPAESQLRIDTAGQAVDDALMYEHAPIPVQFQSQRVRHLELDVFRDDAGGKYANPLIRAATGGGPYDPAMQAPGTKVLHVQDVDYHSNCLALVDCLRRVEAWSAANPSHLPIGILLELKDDPITIGDIELTTPDPWDAAAMDRLEDEILSVVPRDEVLTPDDVRGSHATLEGAITTEGWPSLAETRGRVLFVLNNRGQKRLDYVAGHPALEGRLMFTTAEPGEPDAAVVKRDEPGDGSEIRALVAAGYVVRTRADAEVAEAKTGDTSRLEAALASGAQWISTDYPVEGPTYAQRWGTDYVARLPGGLVARCNPVSAPPGCVSEVLDTIFTPAAPPEPPVAGPAPPAQPVPADATFTG